MLFMICVFALQDVIEFISSEHAEGMLKMFYDYLLMNFIYSFRFKVHIFCFFLFQYLKIRATTRLLKPC